MASGEKTSLRVETASLTEFSQRMVERNSPRAKVQTDQVNHVPLKRAPKDPPKFQAPGLDSVP